MEKNRIRFAFLNYTYGTNSLRDPAGTVVSRMEPDSMAVDLGLARSKDADFIIVLLHFGTEYARQPDEVGKRMVHSLFKLGADIVLGSHPHVLQPYFIETLMDTFGLAKPRLVIYSLGNFLSNQRRRYTDGGILLHFTLKKTTGETGGTATAIGPVSFTPVWVYIHQTATEKKYFVLPAGSFLEQSPFPIPHASFSAMKLFYEDTCEHLGCPDSTITGDR